MTSTIKKYTAQVSVIVGVFIFILSHQACDSFEAHDTVQMSIDHMSFESEGSYRITGTLVRLGEEELSEFGICWAESEKPDCEESVLELDLPVSAGAFSAIISGLLPGTSYYFRAFAGMEGLRIYSEKKVFTTRPASDDMLMDADGNIYKIVQIGEQVWMAENLKATMFSDRTPIPYVEDPLGWYHFTRESLGFCWYENVQTNGYVYGGLYTWAAATGAFNGILSIEDGVQGVCPDGWHLPSDSEWKQLEMHLGMSQEEVDAVKWRGQDQGKMLKQDGTQYGETPDSGAIDEIGFSALLGGYRHGSAEFMELGQSARFWTSTDNGYGYAWYRRLDHDTTAVYRDFTGVYSGHSVRCVKDE